MSAMLSPLVYLRCSENSTENPWNGLACRPAMKPSTMNFARRSSRETWRITSGFRYCSAVVGKEASCCRAALIRSASLLVLGDLRLANLVQQPLDQAFGRLTLGLRL